MHDINDNELHIGDKVAYISGKNICCCLEIGHITNIYQKKNSTAYECSVDGHPHIHKIKSEDLIFSDDIEDDRTNTYLTLNDYDWMNYTLSTRFRTKDMGLLNVKFEYVGFTAFMYITKQNDCKTIDIAYNFSTDIFKKHIIDFLQKHIASWDSQYAFNGEEEVIDFYNDVLEHGTVSEIGNHIIN